MPLIDDGVLPVDDPNFETNEVFTNILFLPTGAASIAEDVPSTISPGNPGFGKITNQILTSQLPLSITEFIFPPQSPNPELAGEMTGHGGGLVLDKVRGNFWLTAQFDNTLIKFDPRTGRIEEFGAAGNPAIGRFGLSRTGTKRCFPSLSHDWQRRESMVDRPE